MTSLRVLQHKNEKTSWTVGDVFVIFGKDPKIHHRCLIIRYENTHLVVKRFDERWKEIIEPTQCILHHKIVENEAIYVGSIMEGYLEATD